MTLEEKVRLTAGVSSSNGCSGNVPNITRLGFPGMCLSDAGQGLRGADFVSSFPSGIHVGASWNKDLANRRGAALGAEFKKKGVNVLLGPVVGPAWRVTLGGRNWESFSADPYLSGNLAAQSIIGIQGQGVMTSTKVSQHQLRPAPTDMRSTLLPMNKKQIETPTATSNPSPPTLTTRPCMSYTYGKI